MTGQAEELLEIREFAVRLASEAGDLMMPWFRNVSVEIKPDGTEVTEADRRAETHIRERLDRHFPDAAVLGEEFGGDKHRQKGDQWIIDPLDGTGAFAIGSPMFGILLALLRDGDPIVGVIHFPALGESVFASLGSGCWYTAGNMPPERIKTDAIRDLGDAIVSASGVHASELQPIPSVPSYRLAPLIASVKKFRVVGDCIQHALLCRGHLHLAIDPIMSPWDSAALIPCVREAGGSLALLDGGDDLVFGGSLISASDPEILSAGLAKMKG